MRELITITFTILALGLFSPLMILIAVCIYLEDKGSIFFLQERIGLREIPFMVIKFRTMRDGKVTYVGNILRKTGLDELAQLFNILIGDMNIVGPRPLTRYDIDRLGWNQYKFTKRFSVKPGLTGLAQIYGGRGARISKVFEFSYLKLSSLSLDLRIIFVTFFMNAFGKKKIRNYLWKKLKSRRRTPSWKNWLTYFKKNSLSPMKESIDTVNLSERKLEALRYSLSIFQLGESGEGRIAKEIDKCNIYGVNETYRECLKLFVKEEGKHGRLLALMVRSLGGKLAKHNWTESLFSFGRRLMGIRLKLLVLLAAEAVSVVFYKLFIKELPLSGMRATLIEICRDEEFHLRFHQDFFKIRMNTKFSKIIFKLLWRSITLTAFCVVVLDHRKSLLVFNASITKIFEEYKSIVLKVEEEVCFKNNLSKPFSKLVLHLR